MASPRLDGSPADPPPSGPPHGPRARSRADTTREAVVAVVGSGPAGSAAARLLASWGHQVVLLAGPPRRRPAHAESLPPSSRKLLDTLGLGHRVSGAFLPCAGNLVAWDGPDLQARPFGGRLPGFQVERHVLDALLLDGAREAGVQVMDGAVVREVTPPPAHAPAEGCTIAWESPSASGELPARWLLDASGRSGIVARKGFRLRGTGPATTALIGVWQTPPAWSRLAEATLDAPTLVEAYEDGWGWAVPTVDGRLYVAAMVDPRRSASPRGASLEGAYRGELARTRHLRGLLTDATLLAPPWATATTPYGCRLHGADGVLLLGDAGSFLDPLSSFGVKKALASAWLGAVVVHTALRDPERTPAALGLYHERETAALQASRVGAADLYRRAARRWAHPFWTIRAEDHDGGPPPTDPFQEADPDPGVLLRDPRVVAALTWLRGRDDLQLQAAPDVQRIRRPTVQGHEVVMVEHLARPAAPRGLRYLQGVDLQTVADLAAEADTVADLLDRYDRVAPPAPPPAVLGALSTLVGLGFLECSDPSARPPLPGSTGPRAPLPAPS